MRKAPRATGHPHFVLGIWFDAGKLHFMKKIVYLLFAGMVVTMLVLSGCSKDEGDLTAPPDTNAPAKKAP